MQTVEKYQVVALRLTDAFDRRTDGNANKPVHAFDKIINKMIERGWQPLGQPFIILDDRWQQINQAMVKYAKPVEHHEHDDFREHAQTSQK